MDFYYVSIFKLGIKFYYTSTTYFSRRDRGDSQLRKQKHNCYFISTTANFYVGIVQTNGKTANAMSQLQMKCHNSNSNGTTAKTNR